MKTIINGQWRDIEEGLSVTRLLETMQISPERVVVELNLAILKRAQYAGTFLKEGDQVEIVQFVGGGV